SENCTRTTGTVARRSEKRGASDHYQGRSLDSLHARRRGHEPGSRARICFRRARHHSFEVSAPLASESDLGLVFAWDHPRRRRLAITGFLGGSVVLHALCFYVFQIIYPPAVALLPPPGRVTVIAPNTEEGRVLLRWLEAEDPALASTTLPPADAKALTMPTIQHAPSYLMRQPALREMPPPPPDPAIPSAR